LKNILKNLSKKETKINIFQQFVVLLESRLDINLVRLKLVKTIFQAKQLINHKKIKINNIIISKPNFILEKGDIIHIIK
jgi:small subunit ribosomal protein S4